MLSPEQFSWAGHWFARYHCDVLALNACHMPASHEMGIESSYQFAGTLGLKSMISCPDIIFHHLFDVYSQYQRYVFCEMFGMYWTPVLLTT
jgi:hypothetical protein